MGLIIVFSLVLVAGQNISVSHPSDIDYGDDFDFSVTLINFSAGLYDIMVYITNSSGNSIANAWNGSEWVPSSQYVNGAINTSESNSSLIRLNITKIWNDTADIEVRVRNEGTFPGYTINVHYNPSGGGDDPPEDDEVDVDLDYGDEVRNGVEFTVDIDLSNLENMDYDIKVYVTYVEDETIISETYHEIGDDWKSSNYYIDELITGPGDESITLKLRIKEEYEDFSGEAKIKARIRETSSEDVVGDFEGNIDILEQENDDPPDDDPDPPSSPPPDNDDNSADENIEDTGVIRLNIPQQEDIKTKDSNVFYKSKLEYIREYGIYGFAFMCIIIIFILLRSI